MLYVGDNDIIYDIINQFENGVIHVTTDMKSARI